MRRSFSDAVKTSMRDKSGYPISVEDILYVSWPANTILHGQRGIVQGEKQAGDGQTGVSILFAGRRQPTNILPEHLTSIPVVVSRRRDDTFSHRRSRQYLAGFSFGGWG